MGKKFLKPVLLLVSFLLLGFALGTRFSSLPIRPNANEVTVSELTRDLQKKNFTLINVHTPYEGEIGKTDTFIPYDQILASSDSLPKDKSAPIILYCKTGRMSLEALETIKKLGYTNVKHLAGGMEAWRKAGGKLLDLSKLESEVVPESGSELPVSWGDLGPKLVANGTIDLPKFRQAAKPTNDQEQILAKGTDQKIKIDRGNVQFIVDLLWALGLAQKSLVYDQGPMGQEQKAQAGNFASTGGWTLAVGGAMQHYNSHNLIPLTATQQKQVAEISKNVYRPCCGNSTYFPDCNHGMAALAMIELMVAQNVDEKTIYRKILEFNSYWFPDTYLTTATYFARQGTPWRDVDAKEIMGAAFSSGQGAKSIAQKVGPLPWRTKNSSSCGA